VSDTLSCSFVSLAARSCEFRIVSFFFTPPSCHDRPDALFALLHRGMDERNTAVGLLPGLLAAWLKITPVTFRPGRAMLVTRPRSTGSYSIAAITIGTVDDACWLALSAASAGAKMTSTFSATNSAARADKSSYLPAAVRNSMATFLPSMYPRSRNPDRKASSGTDPRPEPANSTPTRCTFPVSWALAACGHATAAPPRRVMNSRRLMDCPQAWEIQPSTLVVEMACGASQQFSQADFRSGSRALFSRCPRRVRSIPDTGHIARSQRTAAQGQSRP
jgi:hypothetical protein